MIASNEFLQCWRRIVERCGAPELLLLGAIILPHVLQAQPTPFCAFEMRVKTPDGRPFPEVPVIMVSGHTTTFAETATDAGGGAMLCDAPSEAVDLVVGFDICGSVTVKSLRPTWPSTQVVSVTYAKRFCDDFAVASSCRIQIRIEGERARPISGARFGGALHRAATECQRFIR